MAIVVDATLVVVLATRDPRVDAVEHRVQTWVDQGEELHAPSLLPYEVANALTRLVAAGRLKPSDVEKAWMFVLVEDIPLQLHPLVAGPQVIGIAHRLGRASAYDAAYL